MVQIRHFSGLFILFLVVYGVSTSCTKQVNYQPQITALQTSLAALVRIPFKLTRVPGY